MSHLPSRPQNLIPLETPATPTPVFQAGPKRRDHPQEGRIGGVMRGSKALTTEQPCGRCWPRGPTDV